MTERYDRIAAAHFAAYRPPLHQLILRNVLSSEDLFSVGLDVGCGTGHSAVALADYCTSVYGIDPSTSMLTKAAAHEKVVYLAGTAERMPLPEHSFDIVTLAGSLYYADTDAASAEILRVCRNDATVLSYDFDILLGQVLQRLGMDSQANGSDYDHRANFSGIDGFTELEVGSRRVSIAVTAPELAHILLSDSHRFDRLASRHDASDVLPALVTDLQRIKDHTTLEADIYFSKYRVIISE